MVSLRAVPLRHYFQALLIYSVLLTLAFSTRWVSGKKLLFEVLWDPVSVQLIYPGDRLESQAIRSGKIALWNPYAGFGSTLLIPSGTTLLLPFKIIDNIWGTDNGREFVLLLRLLVAGFLAYVFARGVALSHPAGLLTGAGYMLCGYFRWFVNFQDLNPYAFLPICTLFALRLFSRRKLFDWLFLIIFLMIAICGGHPEPIYHCAAAVIYTGFFLFAAKALSREEKIWPAFLGSAVFSILVVVSFHFYHHLTFPFYEMLGLGWTFHPQGLGQVHFDLNHAIAMATPIFDFWFKLPEVFSGNVAQFTPVATYLGLLFCSLALLTLFNVSRSSRVVCFTWTLALVLLGVFYGLPGFNLLTSLPVVNRLQNFRYLQPMLAFCVAVMAGFGFDQLKEKRSRLIYSGILAALCPWLLYHLVVFRKFIIQNPIFLLAAVLLVVFFGGLAGYYLIRRRFEIFGVSMKSIIFAAASLELFGYFVFMSPFFGPEAFQLKKPAFMGRAKIAPEFYRFYSPDQSVIPPNTSSLFGLRDVREKLPLYPQAYFNFISAVNGWKNEQEAVDEFLSEGRFFLPLRLDRIPERAQDLLFGYLATERAIGGEQIRDRFVSGSLLAPQPNYFSEDRFELNGKTREGFLLHPPSRFEAAREISAGPLAFEIGLLAPEGSRSDGADFAVFGGAKGKSLLFARSLSLGESRKRGWINFTLNLEASRKIELATLPGPQADPTQDFAIFASLRKTDETAAAQYKLIFDAGPFLYQRRHATPRFFLAGSVSFVETAQEALELVRAGNFSEEEVSIVSAGGEDRPSAQTSAGKISLVRDETDLVELTVKLGSQGWLMMTDTYFPGWHGYIDGKEVRIYRANYLFRGMPVPPGKHRVKFLYRPLSFEIGIYQNLAFLFTAIAGLVLLAARKR